MSTNVRKFRFLVIFDTGDILHNWSISLLLPIVLYNLIESEYCRSLEYTPRAWFILEMLFHVEEKGIKRGGGLIKRKLFSCLKKVIELTRY